MIDLADKIAAAMPPAVREVCARLTGAGFAAFAVGGAVRDALLGRVIGDWDIATSAHPEQVVALFPRTVPTGLQHGTVTVVMGRGRRRTSIEVTTFRGEGGYSDGRHPDTVTFGVTLDEDLARRDFVINAIAFDPVAAVLCDPFGGVADLERRWIRAVGDPVARFSEDGLRVMRAVRFAATLEFDLCADTEGAIAPALSALAKVSRERIRDELSKILAARLPSAGLVIAARTGILAQILPEVVFTADLAATIDAAPAAVRWAALLSAVGADRADRVGRRLKLAIADRTALVRLLGALPPPPLASDADLRRLVGRVGRSDSPALAALWAAVGADPSSVARLEAAAGAPAPVTVAELAIGGGDVMRILGVPPGPIVGEVLAGLLERVLVDPSLDGRALEDTVIAIAAEVGRKT